MFYQNINDKVGDDGDGGVNDSAFKDQAEKRERERERERVLVGVWCASWSGLFTSCLMLWKMFSAQMG